MDLTETLNLQFIDAQYKVWKADPNAVSRDWRFFFEGFEMGGAGHLETAALLDEDQILQQSRMDALVHRYRDIGHLLACLDPLVACPTDHPLLSLTEFDFTADDLDTEFYTGHLLATERATLADILKSLKKPIVAPSVSSLCICRTQPNAAGCKIAWSRFKTALKWIVKPRLEF